MSEFKGLTADQQALLTEIVRTILPEGAVPGAVSLGVPTFIQTMLADCYESAVREMVRNGLAAMNDLAKQRYQQDFAGLAPQQKQELLKTVDRAADTDVQRCYRLLKDLTIQGYTSSEYVLVNHLNYVMAPGHFHGCVPV